MKLMDDFFKVLESSGSVTGFITTVALDPGHIVYKGHFPGHPVTPGVIQMQIVHELLEHHFGRKLSLITMPSCKFLKVLDPRETPQLVVHVEFTRTDDLLNIKARGENGSTVFFKLNGTYLCKNPKELNV